MKKAEIIVGGIYVAKVSGKLTKVRVDTIRDRVEKVGRGPSLQYRDSLRYDVTNLSTGRKTTFRSAAKFRSSVGFAGIVNGAAGNGKTISPNVGINDSGRMA